ncbi:iron-sulfur cluster co-chaperone protein HscB isoform X1 [Tachyglossus aculeatus]|uniref:iron-sulfur cluster co-chaperone protein HscB isoform X1 n=2 Tax=Tachyglossus aculeatus TaxID=9261 RepID=UPI0018F3BA06|nr:iron-sulfur cluster co-chaperone protein HscB isoform X1 [Tachyglossus aculeatus]
MWRAGTEAPLRLWATLRAGASAGKSLSRGAAAQAQSGPRCWSCGESRGAGDAHALFCPTCRALQPPDLSRDFFRLMDCCRSFTVDVRKLQRRFQQLQHLVHPDHFSQRSQTERDFSEKHSALVNEAYKTLLTPLSRGFYLLKLSGLVIPEGTDSEMDMQFLVEVMEVNEKLAEAQSEAEIEEVETLVKDKQKKLTEDVSRAFEQDDLQKAKELLTKMRYFSNLEEKVKIKKIPS